MQFRFPCLALFWVKIYTSTGGWGGWEEKWSLKLPQPSFVWVEVEAELGNSLGKKFITCFMGHHVG